MLQQSESCNSNAKCWQVGCGVGNTAYPLLELNQSSYVHACDFSPSAVAMVKAHPQYSSGRMHAFVADITSDDLRAEVPANSVDFCTMVFVLSAITPAKMPAVSVGVAPHYSTPLTWITFLSLGMAVVQ